MHRVYHDRTRYTHTPAHRMYMEFDAIVPVSVAHHTENMNEIYSMECFCWICIFHTGKSQKNAAPNIAIACIKYLYISHMWTVGTITQKYPKHQRQHFIEPCQNDLLSLLMFDISMSSNISFCPAHKCWRHQFDSARWAVRIKETTQEWLKMKNRCSTFSLPFVIHMALHI